MFDKRFLLSAAFVLLGTTPIFAAGPSFHPDVTFHGSSLAGWHTLGQANWHAENGELVGTPAAGGGGGWLVLDRSFQDVGLFAEFRCTGGCETGELFRAEKTPDGWKGIYVALSEPGTPSYSVTLDERGKILTRDKLRRGGGLIRVAPPLNPNAPTRRFSGFPRYSVKLPFDRPDTALRPDDWNEIECMFDANIIRAVLNNGSEAGGVADEGYGPVALYVGGTGEVRFRNLAYKDLGLRVRIPDKTSSDFRRQKISDFYYSMSAAAADFNHDGSLDIVSGPYIYYGPDYKKRSEIALGESTSPSTSFNEYWVEYAADFTGDGWPDVINVTYGGPTAGVYLYVNPKVDNRRWEKFKVVSNVQSEIGLVANIDGSGLAVVYMGEGYVSYAKPDPSNPTGPWVVKHVSEQGYGTAHGLGVGDINGDGRLDIVNMYGWWEQPPAGSDQPWKYHPEVFGRYGHGIAGGATMAVYDVNGDGLMDVVTTLNAHGWGMAWYEQKRDAQGNISFVQHMIMDDLGTQKENAGGVVFSEPHGTTYADMNGDGIPDFIVGKRFWSHNADYLDPNPFGSPVLYWYKTVRNPKAPGGAEFVPEFIDNRSGAGSTLLAVDLNKDGAIDVVSATKLGTVIFWGKPHAHKAAAAHK